MEDGMTPEGYKPDLASLRRMLSDAMSLTEEARKEQQIDGDYYDGYQYTPDERRALESRKQPDLVFNRIRPAINGTLGVLRQGNTDPRAYPRNPGDQDAADVASKTLRFIADQNRFDELKLRCAKDYLVPGLTAAVVGVDGEDVTIEQVRWEEFIYDPRSRREDFEDARYLGIAKWMYADDLAAMYPDSAKEIEAAVDIAPVATSDSMEDRPRDGQVSWVDGRKKRLLVVEMYHRDGGWKRCVFHGGGVLEASDSPYLDDRRQPTCPIVAQSCFVDRENNRYGLVRDMRGPQDEINKRRAKLLDLVSRRQVQEAEYGALAGVDPEIIRKEAARPDGVLPSGAIIVPTTDMAAGQAQLLAEAKAEIERMGPNPAMLGRQGSDTSGRAQLVRQQAGLTELAIVFGGVEDWELRVYRQMWARARQFWQAPKWIRITDDDGAPEFIGVNQPTIIQTPYGPMQGPVDNPIADLDIDIILDTVPDTANVQQEQFAMLVDLAKVGALGPMAGMFLLEASSLPNKRDVIEKLEAQMQQPNPAAEIEMRQGQADIAKTEAEAALKGAQATTEMQSAMMPAMPVAGAFPGV